MLNYEYLGSIYVGNDDYKEGETRWGIENRNIHLRPASKEVRMREDDRFEKIGDNEYMLKKRCQPYPEGDARNTITYKKLWWYQSETFHPNFGATASLISGEFGKWPDVKKYIMPLSDRHMGKYIFSIVKTR